LKLQNALLQIDELTGKNKALEEELRLGAPGREVGRRGKVPRYLKCGDCLVLGDSIIRNVGTECSDVKAECFPCIRTEELYRVIENRVLVSPYVVVFHVGTNDLRRPGYLDYVVGDVYDLVNTAKTRFLKSRAVLCGMWRRRDLSWRRIGALNSRYGWVVSTLGVNFVDLNSCVDDWDFGRDGLQINRRGARRLDQLYSRVCGIGGGRQKMKSA
jgi:hypothetical protein